MAIWYNEQGYKKSLPERTTVAEEVRQRVRMGAKMSRIGIFFAEGYEEIEALTVVDLVRGGGESPLT